jgi:polynucleotide 5'-kinase involved in rRNA processing
MKYNNLNKILDREKTKEDIINCINEIDSNLKILNYKSVLFVSGPIGCGKSTFVNDILIELNYDIINFETEQNRNSSNFDFIKSFNFF